ncbi:MAG TPA: hypothetical protein VNS61_02880, partial [Caldimonas sp.]|nr:hypothetical protein [Caldimonas sp.]
MPQGICFRSGNDGACAEFLQPQEFFSMLSINTNISSLTAQNNVSKTANALTSAITRLSSGLRI